MTLFACYLVLPPFSAASGPLLPPRPFTLPSLVLLYIWLSYLSSFSAAYSLETQDMLLTSAQHHNMPVDHPAKKNTSRSKCRRLACGNGKPRFKHICNKCNKWFCPKCVLSDKHNCLAIEPDPEPYIDESVIAHSDAHQMDTPTG